MDFGDEEDKNSEDEEEEKDRFEEQKISYVYKH